jgi:hypothetical protein
MTDHYRLGLKQQELFFSQFWRLKAETTVSSGLVSLKTSLLDFHMEAFFLCSHYFFSVTICALITFHRNIRRIGLGCVLLTSFYLYCPFKVQLR